MNYEIVQVVPHEDYTVWVYFSDGKITCYDMKDKLDKGVFTKIKVLSTFLNCCKIMNDTLAWDVGENGEEDCIDIDPIVLYNSPEVIDVSA